MSIRIAASETDIDRCFAVMSQLRPDFDRGGFVAQVRRQQSAGYRLAMLEQDHEVVALAGYRIGENLAWGKHVYVDDLVTDGAARSRGHGRRLLRWLIAEARREGCRELHLDSGVQRFAAHRFYLVQGLDITSHHFRIRL